MKWGDNALGKPAFLPTNRFHRPLECSRTSRLSDLAASEQSLPFCSPLGGLSIRIVLVYFWRYKDIYGHLGYLSDSRNILPELLGGCISFLGCHSRLPHAGQLKTQKFVLSQFWKVKVWNQGDNRAMFPLKALGKDLSLLLPSYGGSWEPWGSLTYSCITPVFVFITTSPFFPCVILCIFFSSHKGTSHWV